eukprot:2184777-Prymnesium_polylepis.1
MDSPPTYYSAGVAGGLEGRAGVDFRQGISLPVVAELVVAVAVAAEAAKAATGSYIELERQSRGALAVLAVSLCAWVSVGAMCAMCAWPR